MDVNERGHPPQRWCPLHCSAFAGRVEVARYLVENRADTSLQDEDGWTALHLASTKGHNEFVKFLLEARAGHWIKDNDGFTALHEAARNNHLTVLELLREAGADIDVRTIHGASLQSLYSMPGLFAHAMKSGRTPMHWAACNGHVEALDRLVEAGGSVGARDHQGDTPFLLAARNGNLEVLRALLRRQGRQDEVNSFGWNAVHCAASNGQSNCLRLLVEGSEQLLNAKDKAAQTPLHVAVLRSHPSCVKVLLELGAEMDTAGPLGLTALHYACRSEQPEIVKLLVEAKADMEAKDEEGWTALHWACASSSDSCAALLVAAGADTQARNGDSLLPFDVASDATRFVLTQAHSSAAPPAHPPPMTDGYYVWPYGVSSERWMASYGGEAMAAVPVSASVQEVYSDVWSSFAQMSSNHVYLHTTGLEAPQEQARTTAYPVSYGYYVSDQYASSTPGYS